jgi:lycopene cyclase domain-containing protein
MMCVFIPWDILKTDKGVWGFNSDYLLGIYFFNLPIEECLFFICIPYSCIFIYECVVAYIHKDFFQKSYQFIFKALAVLLLFVGLYNYSKWYATVTFPFTALLILFIFKYTSHQYLSKFLLAYLIILIPFFIVNGVLTGSFIESPIVWYSPEKIFNIRIGTIPIEDTMYNLGMLLLVMVFYNWFQKRAAN